MRVEPARRLFDSNAATYDRVNTVISLGMDARWRRWVARSAVRSPSDRVLDAFTGTGMVAVEAAALGAEVTAADASPRMLDAALGNAARRGVRIEVRETDLAAESLPFAAGSFDAVTVSFGIRYLDDPVGVLGRLAGTLAADGRLVLLEFVDPRPGPISSPAALYFFRALPKLAALLAGSGELYEQLVATTRAIGSADDVARMLESASLVVSASRSFGFGLVTGVVAGVRA